MFSRRCLSIFASKERMVSRGRSRRWRVGLERSGSAVWVSIQPWYDSLNRYCTYWSIDPRGQCAAWSGGKRKTRNRLGTLRTLAFTPFDSEWSGHTRVMGFLQGSVGIGLAGERLLVLVAESLGDLGRVALGADRASFTGGVGVGGVHFASVGRYSR